MRDLAGERFGLLTVISLDGCDEWWQKYWLCRCDCGAVVRARQTKLVRHLVVSCGCIGYRRDAERHIEARLKVPPDERIAALGAKAR